MSALGRPPRILVPVKRVVDSSITVAIDRARRGIQNYANLKFSINPFDELAVEEAVRLHEAGSADDVSGSTPPLPSVVPLAHVHARSPKPGFAL